MTERALTTALCISLAALTTLLARAAFADNRDQLALEIAIVAVHEGAFVNAEETALVWQVVEHRAQTTAGRIAFLRKHSPRALGRKACRGGNCTWTPQLLKAPNAPPASLDAAWWNAARAERWLLIRERALRLVYGIDDARPCPAPPYSWGCAIDLDGARKRGLRPIGCAGLINDGFALARRKR